ncbi:signal peptide peptidase-like 2C [Physeter macrocephalus]|uniref:Signal peptide peptidase-like 2C n=1 Tax=Physeter macrocephalus TaxID=9755 RepID=A0A2Y9F0I1_PHYMC|nr:signal peptide peptidase-like 2C [Physeter catodon]|eukprot:XP_007112757.2 signal peptide peptidase-like 2C [Physeter catodon]
MACLGLLLLLLLLVLVSATARGEYAVVHVVSDNWSKDYCVLFRSDYVTLPRDLHHAPLLPLHDGTQAPWCPGEDSSHQAHPGSPSQRPLRQTTAMVMRGNCSSYAKGWLAQARGAHGLLVVSQVSGQRRSDSTPATQDRPKPLPDLTIPVAELHHTDMLDILSYTHGGAGVRVALYAPAEPVLDYNMVVIFILAVGTVAVGGYWAGVTEADWLQWRLAQGGGGPGGHNQQEAVAAQQGPEEEDAAADLTAAVTGAGVTMSSSITLPLYFFYDCFVCVTIAIFSLGASTGLYSCLVPLVHHLPLQQFRWLLPGRRACLQLPLLLLAGLGLVVTVLWVAYRNEDRWAWLLQDTLGVAYCLFVLRHVRLPALKSCASFLLALVAFDVFFVFVTPPLTRTGESVRVEVASGPADPLSLQRLPMVLKVPRLSFSALTLCGRPFSILGFGDIVVPGFLAAYCHRFDVHIRSRQVYFVACTVAYAVGLLVTFAAMALTQVGQPALLYLVSSTLLTSLAVAACRQELTLFWTGQGRAKTAARPVPGLCGAPSVDSGQKRRRAADVHRASELEGGTERLAGDLDSQLGKDTAQIVTISEDEATSPEGHSDSSEGWGDANLEADELPCTHPGASEELTPQMPPPSELGHTHAQAQAHDAGLPWTGLHEKKGLKVKKSMSTQAPL